jgi:polyisoprenoid-binding protein YceI
MRKFILTAALTIAAALPLAAQTPAPVWQVDAVHSNVAFDVRHLVSRVTGRFDDFSGTITGDPANPAAASVEFVIKAASINTRIADRDAHLRSADFFDAEKFPEIRFRSTSIKPTKTKDLYNVTGNLTMHGVTKQVMLPVRFFGPMKEASGSLRGGFETAVKLNRKDYGITWNKAADNGGVLLGDEVNVQIELEAVKK